MRFKRNYSEINNFFTQSKILTERFEARGYNPEVLDKIVEDVGAISREVCLQGKQESIPLINIGIYYCWTKKLRTVLPPRPQFIYRKAPNYGDLVVKKVLDPPIRMQTF